MNDQLPRTGWQGQAGRVDDDGVDWFGVIGFSTWEFLIVFFGHWIKIEHMSRDVY